MKYTTAVCVLLFATAASAGEAPFQQAVDALYDVLPHAVIRGGGETGQGDGCTFAISATKTRLTVKTRVYGRGGPEDNTTVIEAGRPVQVSLARSTLSNNSYAKDLTVSQGSSTTVITLIPAENEHAATVLDVDGCGQDL